MKRDEILRRLEERLARGEISEKTYLEIKARYDAEPLDREAPEESVGAVIEDAVARITEQATQAAEEAVRATSEAMGAIDLRGHGVRLSDEAIKIAGSGVVSGTPVRTREFKAAGSAKVVGDLEAEVAKVAGSCAFEGNVSVEDFRVSGSVRVAGNLRAEAIETSGSVQVDGRIDAESILSSGGLRVGGGVRTEDFNSTGWVRIEGDLVAEEVLIELGGSSRIGSIKAEEVHVRTTGGLLRSRGELAVERIEADEIILEGTTASFVKGEDVRIGPHCRIDVVEARDLVVHEGSEVKERRAPGS